MVSEAQYPTYGGGPSGKKNTKMYLKYIYFVLSILQIHLYIYVHNIYAYIMCIIYVHN